MSILFAILIFSFLIFIHELGHFVAAKLSGVQVNEFSMFMGPAIFKKQVGKTLYAIRCIPLGGYCAMEGEDGDSENPHAFSKAAVWKRMIILLAGAAMNFIAGLLIITALYLPAEGFNVPVVAHIEEGCAIAGEHGIQVGDRVLEVDGQRVFVQSDFSLLLMTNPGDIHDLTLERNGQRIELKDFNMIKREFTDPDGNTSMRFGFSFGMEEATFLSSLQFSWNSVVSMVRSVPLSLKMLITGQASMKDISGPVGIVQMMSETAEESENWIDAMLNMLYFGAFISINLSVMNLLPIPALDGGRAVCLLLTAGAERITGRKIDPKYEAYLHGAGMVLLLILMALVMFKDVFTIFKG